MIVRVNVIAAHDLGSIIAAEDLSWDELAQLLSKPTAENKSAQPLVVGARFTAQRRVNDECLDRNVIPLDLDEGDLTFGQAVAKFQAMGISAIVHTTASHLRVSDKNPNAGPRLRAFIPLSRPVTSAEWPRVQAWIKLHWPSADSNAIDIARISYAPVPSSEYQCMTCAR